jgi:hypothetical protein
MKLAKITLIVLSLLAVSACAPLGPSEAERALCGKIGSNIRSFEASIAPISRMDKSDISWALIQSAQDREDYILKVRETLPWILSLPEGNPSDFGYFFNLIEARAWEIATKDSEVEFILDSSKNEQLLADSELDLDSLLPKPTWEFIGPDVGACELYDISLEEDEDRDEITDTGMQLIQLSTSLRSIVEASLVIRECQQTGSYDGSKCSESRYVSSTETIDTCPGKLKVTINTARYGDCGELTFTVFQADLNTGDYRALAWWTDENGNRQLGMFMIDGLEEGSTYTMKVSVGRETTYTNELGAEKTVVTFLDQ